MSSLLLTTMRLAVLLKQILTSTDLLVVLVGQFIRLFQLKDERGQRFD